jgi:hypothetical protein
MTRRQGIMAAIAGVIGIMSGKAKSENLLAPTGSTSLGLQQKPQFVIFDLNIFSKFTFSLDGESVTVTGKEIFDVLKESQPK